jgi:hypothetical protein
MKIIVNAVKPRNPLVALARLCRSGSHRPGPSAARQRASRLLKRELEHIEHSP